jgi:hypothetical protein
MKKKYLIGLLFIIIISFSYGIFVGHYKIFPFNAISDTKFFLTNTKPEKSIHRPQIYENPNDVIKLIRIENKDDITKKRQDLINYIWAGKDFPYSKMPNSTQNNIDVPEFKDLKNLKRIDSFTTVMEYDMNSIAYLFLAENSNNKLVVFHQGHEGEDFSLDKDKIQFFLNHDYSVLIFAMVTHGMNNEPILNLPEFGTLRLNSHNHFKLIESTTFHPIKYFVEPIALSLNYIDKNYNFNKYYMVGLSGGGWTTVLYSALDERISQSYPVAGSFPMYLRADSANFGDYEQTLPDLYRIANYEELYVMDSYGHDRKSVQIFNKSDPCCFPAELYEEFPYGPTIKTKLSQLGEGTFDVIIDETAKKHEISQFAMNKILDSMNS